MEKIKKIELNVKSTMNGIFRRLHLRIKPEVSCEMINNRLIVHVKIPQEKLLFMEMSNISKDNICNEFFNKIAKHVKSRNPLIMGIIIQYEEK